MASGRLIHSGVQSEVIVNGLDFYLTILSMVGVDRPHGKSFEGYDLTALLMQEPSDSSLVRQSDG